MATDPRIPAPLTRSRDGRVLAGVCAGLARHRGLPAGGLRATFAAAALLGGVGVLVYLACWLIVPGEDDEAGGRGETRGVVVLAQACAALVALASLAGLGAAATLFGYGWIVLAVGGVALAVALAGWPRSGPAWALLPVAALALPSVGVAAARLHLHPQSGSIVATPRVLAEIPGEGYRSGLGKMLIDLRHTELPATGNFVVRVDAGIRRTIVALPHDRCVHVAVRYDVKPFVSDVAQLVTRRDELRSSAVTLFGRASFANAGVATTTRGAKAPGPTLYVEFESDGGGLYVRDYPDALDPSGMVDWPGYPVHPEPRPDTAGLKRAEARFLLANWRRRHADQVRDKRRVDRLLPGPCAAEAGR